MPHDVAEWNGRHETLSFQHRVVFGMQEAQSLREQNAVLPILSHTLAAQGSEGSARTGPLGGGKERVPSCQCVLLQHRSVGKEPSRAGLLSNSTCHDADAGMKGLASLPRLPVCDHTANPSGLIQVVFVFPQECDKRIEFLTTDFRLVCTRRECAGHTMLLPRGPLNGQVLQARTYRQIGCLNGGLQTCRAGVCSCSRETLLGYILTYLPS